MYRVVIFVLTLFLFAYCVPVKKQTYLQDKKKGELKNFPKDEVVKTIEVDQYEYQLQSGDIISIKISSLTPEEWNFLTKGQGREAGNQQDPLLSGYLIDEAGEIELPVVGKVHIAGLTIDQAKEKIRKAVDGYLKSPTIHLNLLNFTVTILGEVGRQGAVTTYDPRINILQALGKAGGVTDFADRANVKVLRREGKEVKIAYVDILDDNLIASPYYYLKPNDIIVVRPLGAKTFNQFTARNISLALSVISILSILTLRFL